MRDPRERRGGPLSRAAIVGAFLGLTLAGCGVSALDTSIGVINTLGGVASAAGEHVNADFARDDRACLYGETGAPVTTSLDQQAACLTRIRTAYAPALRAYDDFALAWKAMALVIHDAQAAEAIGQTPNLDGIAALLPELFKTADAFTAVYRALSPSLAPTTTTAVPVPSKAPGATPTSTAAPASNGSN